jgi:outer membrane receptor protein involved in Fe transport
MGRQGEKKMACRDPDSAIGPSAASARRRPSGSRVILALLAGLWASAAAASGDEGDPAADTLETIPVRDTRAQEIPREQEAAVLETITVTANKRVATQRDIPGSVAAIRGEDLEAIQAQSMADYLKRIPGIAYADVGTEESVPVIRGIATQLTFGFAPQTTGIYLDDMPFADPFLPLSLPDLNPFDLERVEVLKGPQGTLFGPAALVGAVRYILHRPDPGAWQAKLAHTISQTDFSADLGRVTAGAVNVPLFGDQLALRAVGVSRRDAGVYDMSAHDDQGNVLRDDKDADRLDQDSARLLVRWYPPVESLEVSVFYFDQQTHSGDFAVAGNLETPERGDVPFASPREHDFGGGNLLAAYDLGWGGLVSSTNRMTKHNYLLQHQEEGFGLDHQNQSDFYTVFANDVRGYTQELRLVSPEGGRTGNWQWLAAASYLSYGNFLWQYAHNPGEPASPPPQHADEVTQVQRDTAFVFLTVDSEVTETALFGEATRRLGAWELTAGARYYRIEGITDTLLTGAQVIGLFQSTEDRRHYEQAEEGLSPKIALRYLHDRDLQLYLLASKGFQFGGIQITPPAPGFPESAEQAGFHFGPYKSSRLWNYEAGLRTEWLDRRLRFDLTCYYMDWDELQQTVQIPIAATGGLATFTAVVNVGRAHSEGAEVALEVIPFTGAKWTSAAAWISALADVPIHVPDSTGRVLPAGTRLPGSPRFQWSNVLSYESPVPFLTGWTIAPAVTHARIGSAPDALAATGTVGGYQTFDARLTLAKAESPFRPEISLGVNNLTDARGVTAHFAGTDAFDDGERVELAHFVRPRTVMLSLGLRYF